MKKQLLSVLLCLIMVAGMLPTAALADEAPPFDLTKDLAGITIPDNLVTCICEKANESKSYGQLPGGFSASQPLMEDGSWTGHSSNYLFVNFTGEGIASGQFVDVRITEAGKNRLIGVVETTKEEG